MLTSRSLLVVSTFLLAAPLAGCGGGDDGKSAGDATENATTKVSGTTEQGTELAASGDSTPSDWPKGLVAPDGATVTSVISEGDVDTVSGTATADPVALAAAFADSMKTDGWTKTQRSSDENSIVVEDWEKEAARAQVSTVAASGGSTFTLIHSPN